MQGFSCSELRENTHQRLFTSLDWSDPFPARQELVFKAFFEDVSINTRILSLAKDSYLKLPDIKKRFNLDFDDAYQFQVAEDHQLAIATMDKDFNRVRGALEVVPIP